MQWFAGVGQLPSAGRKYIVWQRFIVSNTTSPLRITSQLAFAPPWRKKKVLTGGIEPPTLAFPVNQHLARATAHRPTRIDLPTTSNPQGMLPILVPRSNQLS
jgi:hypothetical protein